MAQSIRCSTCGAALERSTRRCTTCRTENPAGVPVTWVKQCPRCRYQGYGDHYFSKMQNVALLVLLSILTSGIGGLAYWLMRHSSRVCPGCGMNWRRASYRAVSHPDADAGSPEALTPYGGSRAPAMSMPPEGDSTGGWLRIGGGALLGLVGFGWITGAAQMMGMGLGFMPLFLFGAGVAAGGGGVGLISSGLGKLRGRREADTDQLTGGILRLAGERGGRLTVTEVAAYMDLPLAAAKKLLDGMELENSLYVNSEVTDEGVIVYEFPELRRWLGDAEKSESGET